MNLLKKIFKSRKPALQQGDVMRSLPERGCCMGCANWRYTQNGMGECKILKQYTDEGFDCKAWAAKGNDA